MTPFWQHLREEARKHIQRALDEHETGAQAAAALQLNRTHMYELMRKLGMRVKRSNLGNAEWQSLGPPRGFSARPMADSARRLQGSKPAQSAR